VSLVRLIVTTRSSGPLASQPVIKEMPDSVASGTSYIMEFKFIYYFIYDEGVLNYTRFSHIFMIPKFSASSEIIFFVCCQ
jgi:hypothetical protein